MILTGDKLQQDVRNWLSPPDPWKNHNLALGSRHGGTGSWWIEGDTYAEWKSSGASSLIWIHGKRPYIALRSFLQLTITVSAAGAGKSIIWYGDLYIAGARELMLLISSSTIEDIRTLQKSGLASLAFFYCDFRDDQKKNLRGLISSLLVQLGGQSDSYSTVLSDLYVTHDRGSQHASDSKLTDCLKDMLNLPGQATVHIVIDALDECPLTTGSHFPREEVLKIIEGLVE